MGKRTIAYINGYYVIVYSCLYLSSLGWSGVGGHEGFVNGLFQGQVTKPFILCDVLVSAAGFMVASGVRVGGTRVTDGC